MGRFIDFISESSNKGSAEWVETQLYSAWKLVFDNDDSDYIKGYKTVMGDSMGVKADHRIYDGTAEHFSFSIRFYYPFKDSWYYVSGNIMEWKDSATEEDINSWGTSRGSSEHRLDTELPHYNNAKINLNNYCTGYVAVYESDDSKEDPAMIPIKSIKDFDIVGGLISIPRTVKRIIDGNDKDKKTHDSPPTTPNKKPKLTPVGV